MTDAYEKARDYFMEISAQITNIYGMPQTAGRIYGLLAFTPRPMSLEEIAAMLHMAKSGVSTNLRMLEQLGFARKVWVKGDRRDYWDIDLRMADMFYRFVRDNVSQEFELGFKAMNECKRLLSDSDIAEENREEAKSIMKRLEVFETLAADFYVIYGKILSELKSLRDKEEGLLNE